MKTQMKEWEAKVKTTKAQLYKQWEQSKDNDELPKTEREKSLEKLLPKTEREKSLEKLLKPQRAQLAKERVRLKAAEKEIKKQQESLDTILQINLEIESMPTKLALVEAEITK
jgi:hypothetical protein